MNTGGRRGLPLLLAVAALIAIAVGSQVIPHLGLGRAVAAGDPPPSGDPPAGSAGVPDPGSDPANPVDSVRLANVAVAGSVGRTTSYTAQVTGVPSQGGAAEKVVISFAPEPLGSVGKAVTASSCVRESGSTSTWNCDFTVSWSEASAWYASSTVIDGKGETVSQWYAANSPGQIEVYATAYSGRVAEKNEVAEDSPFVGLAGIPENDLPEVPAPLVVPVMLISGAWGARLLARRRKLSRSM